MCSSVVERCPDKTEVEGSIPSTRTKWSKAEFCACGASQLLGLRKESKAAAMFFQQKKQARQGRENFNATALKLFLTDSFHTHKIENFVLLGVKVLKSNGKICLGMILLSN